MKQRYNFVRCALSIIISAALFVSTLFGSDFLSKAVASAYSSASDAEKNVGIITRSLYSSGGTAEKKDEAVFSPGGFASGAQSMVTNEQLTAVPADIAELMKNAEKRYATYEKTGKIEEMQYGATSSSVTYGGISLNNKTDKRDPDLKSMLKTAPALGEINKDEPCVLIYHTHTTEGYELLDKGWYSSDYDSRTKDASKNVVRVGDEIEKQLTDAGFKVIHDKTVYDESYNGAYSRSLVSVEKYLKKYPSISVTLDIHRDAIHYDNKTKSKPTAVINGKKAAQVMIITGCEEGDITDFPDWEKNLCFAVSLQSTATEEFKGLMRPVFFCDRKYNMNVTPCSLLLEFGTDANTLDEAAYSGRLIGKALAEMLTKNM